MDLIGRKTLHKKFGEGIITGQDKTHVIVKFESLEETKPFVYPDCFKTFLKLVDADAAEQADETVKEQEEQKRRKAQQALDEAEARRFTKQMEDAAAKSSKTVEAKPYDTVEEFCEAYKRATISEVMFLKTNGGKRQRIFDGKRIELKNNRYVYTFEADTELTYPEGTQISIWQGDTSIPGLVIGCEDFTIIISTEKDLGLDVTSLEFSAEPWRLLNSLVDRLDGIAAKPSEIVRSLICDGQKTFNIGNGRIATGQQTAVQMSKTQPITFVWGPPGTGKTQTLAKIALAHIELGHRVLMLSYSNVSVDGAIMRVHSMRPDLAPGTLVRYGYARQKDLVNHKHLTSYNLAIHNHPELLQERQSLIAERRKLTRTAVRYVEIERRLTQIRDELSSEEKATVKNAMFVATTVSKTVVDSVIRGDSFDVVIFDEASMAYIPQIVFAASLAKKHFVCMGDFRQLPPIVQGKETSSLNADIFQHCGITYAVDTNRSHKWLCMLDTQYRMHPQIADFASRTMYGGLLHSADGMEQNRHEIKEHLPMPGHSIAFADLSGLMSVCTKTGDNSRVNVLSAFISFALALEAAKHHEVGIITPYHAQSRLLHAMARDVADVNPELMPISCATVHQFQGSEKDVIVYDAVDCYRMPYPGKLLNHMGNNYANRLFNVALTRARGKFIGVANVDYMEHKKLSKVLMFKHMMDTQKNRPSCLTSYELSQPRYAISGSSMSFYEEEDGNRSFLKDITDARREIRIDIPGSAIEDEYTALLTDALQAAKKRGVKVYLRAENKKDIPSALKPLAIENPYVANPVAVIDKKIVWFGMPMSDANFITEGRTLLTDYRPIIRFHGTHTAASLYGFMEMSKTVDQSKNDNREISPDSIADNFANYVLANVKCSCGKPMRLKKSQRGKFFLSCTDYPRCQEIAYVEARDVNKYFYRHGGTGQHCPRCNYSLEAKSGKYGVYIQCCGSQKHRFKLDEI